MIPELYNYTAIYTDLYQLTMAQGYFLSGKHKQQAIFDYFFRKLLTELNILNLLRK